MAQPPYDPQSFDHLAEMYDRAVCIERRHDFFLQNLPLGRRRVLEIGCGTGLLAQELSRHFDSVLAIDISESMLAIARARRPAVNLEYLLADAGSAPLEGEFDAIVSHTTLHHIDDVPALIRRCKAALAPRGRLLIVDVIDRWPRLNRSYAGLTIGAYAASAFDVFRYGPRDALTLFRFRVSRPWLEHLRSDRYLSDAAFRQLYSSLLPGAHISRTRYFANAIWQSEG
jgi:SAM-dependent methyltransferase